MSFFSQFIPLLILIGIGLGFNIISMLTALAINEAVFTENAFQFLLDKYNALDHRSPVPDFFLINSFWLVGSPIIFMIYKQQKKVKSMFGKGFKVLTLILLGQFSMLLLTKQIQYIGEEHKVNWMGCVLCLYFIGCFVYGIQPNPKPKIENQDEL